MTVGQVTATNNDGYATGTASTYATALSGPTSRGSEDAAVDLIIGQALDGSQYRSAQGFAKFAYALPAGEICASVALRGYVNNNVGAVSRDLEARSYAWATPLTGTAYRTSSQLSGLTLIGSVRDSQAATGKYVQMGATNFANLIASGSQTVSVVIAPVRNVGGSPTGLEYTYIASAETPATEKDPALVFTSAPRSTLHGVLAAQAVLSDGSWVVLESDGGTSPVITLRRYAAGAATTVGTLPLGSSGSSFDASPRGTHSLALAVDASDNVYVIGVAGNSLTTFAVQAYTKGAGWTWSAGAVVTSAAPGYNGALNGITACWHGTGGAGVLMVLAGRAAGSGNSNASTNDLCYAVLSASVALAGSGTLALSGGAAVGTLFPAQSHGTYYNTYTNETGAGLDLVPASGGVGYAISHTKGSVLGEAGPVAIGRYEVTGAGVVSGQYRLASSLGVKDAAGKARVLSLGGSAVAVVTADPTSGWGITVQPWQATSGGWTALADPVKLDAEALASMPAASVLAVVGAWDAVYVPAENKVWVYYPDATDPRVLRRTGVSMTTYVATREQVTAVTAGASGGTNLAVRVARNAPAGSSALVTVAHRTSGGALSTEYVSDTFNQPPSAPALLPRAGFDATAAAVFGWEFSDPNAGDVQSAYQLQIVRVSDSLTVVDTGKVASAMTSHTVAGGTLANGQSYQWRVRTWDALDTQGPYSGYGTFSTGAGGSVTITDPAADNPPGLVTDDYLIKWTVAGTVQTAYRARLIRTDTSAVVGDSGWITSATPEAYVSGMLSDVQYRVEITVRNAANVVSTPGTRLLTPSYGSPMPPVATATAVPDGGYVLVTIENPTPVGDRPEVETNEVWRRPAGGEWERIATVAPGEEYRDYQAASGQSYEYRVRGVAP